METNQAVNKLYKSIAEVSQITGIPNHVLRFWEKKFDQIAPKKRRGHRYYQEKDIEIISTIKHLLYEKKFTIEGAKQHLKKLRTQKPELSEVNNVVSITRDAEKILKQTDDASSLISSLIDDINDIRKLLK